jgi:methanogenic corrinoid protein MtbC1
VGELWEHNKISVAREHLATSLTESLMTQVYPLLFNDITNPKGMAIISCTANELHQIGGKMVADLLELNGWDTHFLGANTPAEHLIAHVDEIKPDLLGLSLSIYSRLTEFTKTIEAVRHHYPQLDILAGGQAFLWGGKEVLDRYPSTTYIPSLSALETELSGRIDVP